MKRNTDKYLKANIRIYYKQYTFICTAVQFIYASTHPSVNHKPLGISLCAVRTLWSLMFYYFCMPYDLLL